MKYFRILILISSFLIFYSCGTIKEGFTNQKKTSSDEFLVKKKSPLVMPPEYNELPVPSKIKNEKNFDQNKIKNLVIGNNTEDEIKNAGNFNSGIEDSIIEKIKKD